MSTIYKYNDYEYKDEEGEFTTEEVKRQLTQYFPELANARAEESESPEGDKVVTFVKRAGTKGDGSPLSLGSSGTAPELHGDAGTRGNGSPSCLGSSDTAPELHGGVGTKGDGSPLSLGSSDTAPELQAEPESGSALTSDVEPGALSASCSGFPTPDFADLDHDTAQAPPMSDIALFRLEEQVRGAREGRHTVELDPETVLSLIGESWYLRALLGRPAEGLKAALVDGR